MCVGTMLLGKAIGGRTGAIVGGALGGGVPGALVASQVFKKKKPDQPTTTSPGSLSYSTGG